ncbi:MAG: right-handed parallel beta-helix repeat-containing protein, partial [Chloroflexi bacterium]|nr:right-handed parallel beta-helix repeat-containing protein [Chloroflexota bacterium]
IVTGDNGNGIFIKAHAQRCGSGNIIQNNKILNAVYNAIEFSFCKDNQVIGNELVGSYDAIFFGFTTGTVVRNNTIRDMRNHGIISFNSRGSIIEGNQVVNAREGIYLYWATWNPKEFFFLTPTPDQYAVRDNTIVNNTLTENTVAGIRLTHVIQSRVANNVFANNAKNLSVEGKSDGTIITDSP